MNKLKRGGIVRSDSHVLIGENSHTVSKDISLNNAIVIKIPIALINDSKQLSSYISNELNKWINK